MNSNIKLGLKIFAAGMGLIIAVGVLLALIVLVKFVIPGLWESLQGSGL